MFAIFIICAWSLTLAAAAGLLLFGSTAVAYIMVGSQITTPEGAQAFSGTFLYKLFKTLSLGIGKNIAPVYGQNGVLNQMSIPSQFGPSGANPGNMIAVLSWIIVIFAVAITLLTISIIELVRLRKHQKLSKPFVKVIMVISAIMLLLTFQTILVIVSVLVLTAFVLLEAVLFDSEALNNYAEERNLISIYKEERKFEKEVSKEGKLIGNVDLKNQQEDFQKENDQIKINDNSALPNSTEDQLESIYNEGKAKKYYLKWKANKAKLIEQREEIESKLDSLNEKEQTKVISKFNFNVMKVNSLAKKLKIPESYYVSYMTIENQEGENYMDSNFKSTSISEATAAFGGEESTAVDDEIESLHDRYSGGNKPGVPQTFVAPQTVVHGTKPKNKGLEEEFMRQKMARAVNMDIEQLPLSDYEADADTNSIYADFNFDQPDLAAQVMMKDMKKAQEKQAAIANAAPGTTVSAPPTFTLAVEDQNHMDNFVEERKEPEALGTFVAPQTVVHGTKPQNKGLEAEFMRQKMLRAVNMDISQLPESNMPADADTNSIYADFNFDQPDLAAQVIMQDMKKAQAKQEAIAKGAPGTTVSTLPVFNTNMVLDFDQEQLDAAREAKRNEFVAPQTVVHGTKPKNQGLEEEFVRQKMARAVNMDLNQLAESENPDADKNTIYADFNFDQPDLAAQVMMEDMKKAQAKQAAIANAAPGTTVSAPPSFNVNMLGEQEVSSRPVSFEPEVEYEEEYGLSGSNAPAFGTTPAMETPSANAEMFNINNIKVEPNVPETLESHDKDHSFESYDDEYQKEQNKKDIIQKEEELLNRFEANINSIDLEKLNSIEERMSKLEGLIESLGNKLTGNQLSEDFSKISNQLDSISKVVNELEHNSPRTIIDSLTTRHSYNKKNNG
ncbi:hypothetical protein [Spiroplasma sp. BIUS-1]|uniref:hypothetical protein n=1 Tax=Spiroplasma sp. BIUS-1 TaxID=216964 RepID=UPI0013987F13|nr:hypothetical protein [Spiroplasma sp. BIUS-1]QHX37043.1 hypothetical protein SBIUS_v1c07900 [Spiroplasma sp. BIUS-1]